MTLPVTVSIAAKPFGNYAAQLVVPGDDPARLSGIFGAALLVVLALLNLIGARAVGRAVVLLVGVKLSILLLLMAADIPSRNAAMVAQGRSVDNLTLISRV